MLVVPMSNDKGQLIGVMQLINAQDESGRTIPFDPDIELLVIALSSQAAISITNMRYAEQITKLLDSLVGTLSTAIDERSHYNANHTRNMVRMGENFLDWLEQTNNPWKFDENRRRAFLMSVWLHDVGKLAVPLEVMDKNSRLGPALDGIKERFRIISLLDRIEKLEGRISDTELAHRMQEHAEELTFIERVNKAGFLPDEDCAAVKELAGRTYVDENGAERPLITEAERDCLLIRKGTLTDEERRTMQNHVVVTGRILNQMTFPRIYSQVPGWAAAHHELMNGKGYPDHLTAEDIPNEVRLLTILDIFEALTAHDRPYKLPMSLEKALAVLHNMVDEGSLDRDILALFEQSRAWEGIPVSSDS